MGLLVPSIVTVMMAAAPPSISTQAAEDSGGRTAISHQASAPVLNQIELKRRIRPALAYLTLRDGGVPIATATGFFISQDGKLITSRHLIRTALSVSTSELDLQTSDGKLIRDFKIIGCGDLLTASGPGELCLLKTKYEPKSMFGVFDDLLVTEGGMIGNAIQTSAGQETSVSKGKIQFLESHLAFYSDSDIVAPGSPVVDDRGHFLGVIGDARFDAKPHSDLIAASSVSPFIDAPSAGLSLTESRTANHEQLHTELHQLAQAQMDPAIRLLIEQHSENLPAGFKNVDFQFDHYFMQVAIPEIFDDCSQTEKRRDSTKIICSALGGSALFSITRRDFHGAPELAHLDNKLVVTSESIRAVEQLKRNGEWDLYEPLISEVQKRRMMSVPSRAQCQTLRGNFAAHAMFNQQPACRYSVTNDQELGSYKIAVDVVKEPYLYEFEMWMNDPVLDDYFGRLPSLAVISARSDSSNKPRSSDGALLRSLASHSAGEPPPPNFKIQFPVPISFIGVKNSSDHRTFDLYGKKLLLDHFEEGYSLVVSHSQAGLLPPDYDRHARSTLTAATHLMGATLEAKTLETESATVIDRPARITTAFGKDQKSTDVLVLSATLFTANEIYTITQITSGKDPSDTYKDFQALLGKIRLN